jgi:hypothetical protein
MQQANSAKASELTSLTQTPRLQVRLWLGTHPITDFTGTTDEANRHVAIVTSMHRSLTLTVEPALTPSRAQAPARAADSQAHT